MEKPIIISNFTIEDIYKIRERKAPLNNEVGKQKVKNKKN